MNKGNVLEEGVWELEKLRDQLIGLDQYKRELSNNDIAEQQLEMGLQQKEAQINNEITAVVNQRQQEIAQSYEEQIKRQNAKIKKIREKKEKNKSEKVKERISSETQMLRDSNKKLSEDVSYEFRQGKIARVYNNRLYFAMLAPKGMSDVLLDIIVLLLLFIALPKSLYWIMTPKNRVLFYVVTYGLIILGTGILYYIAYYATKLKNPDAIENSRELRYQMRQNDKQIAKIKRRITKDKDESIYNLDSYNKEIQKLEKKIREIQQEKNEALATLQNTTSNVLASEVRAKHQMEISDLQSQYEVQKEQTHHVEEQIAMITSDLTNNYQAYIGKDLMNVEAVDELIEIMNINQLRAISEGIQLYRNQKVQLQTTSNVPAK
ncbi:MAG: hypothetical protein Q4G58_08660 [bacterium]|nr:hypothetical protein [bacterium]